MRIFQNSSNKVIGLIVKMPATTNNTAYTAHLICPNFGYAGTSYMLKSLGDVMLKIWIKIKEEKK